MLNHEKESHQNNSYALPWSCLLSEIIPCKLQASRTERTGI